jgi:drug/metabolite transporter (DMT)-like permease
MSSSESPQTVVFYFALISSVIACVPAIISWQTPTLEQIGWLLLMACTSTIAQLCLSKGYALAPAGQLGPYTYTSVAIAALFGWWLWDEVLSINSLLGVVFIIVAGVLTAFSRNTKSASSNS